MHSTYQTKSEKDKFVVAHTTQEIDIYSYKVLYMDTVTKTGCLLLTDNPFITNVGVYFTFSDSGELSIFKVGNPNKCLTSLVFNSFVVNLFFIPLFKGVRRFPYQIRKALR